MNSRSNDTNLRLNIVVLKAIKAVDVPDSLKSRLPFMSEDPLSRSQYEAKQQL